MAAIIAPVSNFTHRIHRHRTCYAVSYSIKYYWSSTRRLKASYISMQIRSNAYRFWSYVAYRASPRREYPRLT